MSYQFGAFVLGFGAYVRLRFQDMSTLPAFCWKNWLLYFFTPSSVEAREFQIDGESRVYFQYFGVYWILESFHTVFKHYCSKTNSQGGLAYDG